MSRMNKEPVFAPREAFEQILEYSVIPTFDLVIDVPERGVLMARRKIAPYAGKWALPGLRMFKNETIDDTLLRIATAETGLQIDLDNKVLIGQFKGNFRTEHNRQDLSTGYAVQALSDEVLLNGDNFTGHRFVNSTEDIPTASGAMYRYYLDEYFENPIRQ
jgi:ADP-ribose pyrophosphatase YjhB (NUDIX family)